LAPADNFPYNGNGSVDNLLFNADANTGYVFRVGFVSPVDSGNTMFSIAVELFCISRYDYYTEAALFTEGGGQIEFWFDIASDPVGIVQLIGSEDIEAEIYDEWGYYVGTVAGGGHIELYDGLYKMIIQNNGLDGELIKMVFLASSSLVEYWGEYYDDLDIDFDGHYRAHVYTLTFYASETGTYQLEIGDYYPYADIHIFIYEAETYGETIYKSELGLHEIDLKEGWYFITFYCIDWGYFNLTLVTQGD